MNVPRLARFRPKAAVKLRPAARRQDRCSLPPLLGTPCGGPPARGAPSPLAPGGGCGGGAARAKPAYRKHADPRRAPARRPARPGHPGAGAERRDRPSQGAARRAPGGHFRGQRARRTTNGPELRGAEARSTEARSADAIATPSADALPPTTPTVQGRAAPLLDGRHLHQKSKSDVRRRRLVEVEVLCWESKLLRLHAVLLLLLHGSSVCRGAVDGGHVEKFGKFQRVAQPGECLLNAPFGFCVPWETVAQT